ncbi:hypothetical protein H311_02279, partial [Anncaliia algerae PRA109]
MELLLEKGSVYSGEQDTVTGPPFKMDMKIEFIDINQLFMCGTFKIFNLTSYHDVINTYFECEIVKDFDIKDEINHWSTFSVYNEIKGDYDIN